MRRLFAVSNLGGAMLLALATGVSGQGYIRIVEHEEPGIAYGFAANVLRTDGAELPLADYTVGGQFTARNAAGQDRWAFGVVSEAWALPGSRSVLVGNEAAVINEEPSNTYPKVANNAIFKNRADNGVDPGVPMNAGSIAYWVSAQSGTGFERGLVFAEGSLTSDKEAANPPAAIDLSDLSDEAIAQVDLIRIRKGVSLRYDPVNGELYLHRTSVP